MKKTVKVVAPIIENENNEILCALRSPNMILPNQWEFPGGKVEKGESLHEAIEREIKEELSCTVKAVEIFDENTHDLVEGSPLANEHSEIIYLKRENLNSLVWAPADMPIVKKVINS